MGQRRVQRCTNIGKQSWPSVSTAKGILTEQSSFNREELFPRVQPHRSTNTTLHCVLLISRDFLYCRERGAGVLQAHGHVVVCVWWPICCGWTAAPHPLNTGGQTADPLLSRNSHVLPTERLAGRSGSAVLQAFLLLVQGSPLIPQLKLKAHIQWFPNQCNPDGQYGGGCYDTVLPRPAKVFGGIFQQLKGQILKKIHTYTFVWANWPFSSVAFISSCSQVWRVTFSGRCFKTHIISLHGSPCHMQAAWFRDLRPETTLRPEALRSQSGLRPEALRSQSGAAQGSVS